MTVATGPKSAAMDQAADGVDVLQVSSADPRAS
jgi:hypothetical protein